MVKRDLFIDKYHLKYFRNNLIELDKSQSTIDLYTYNIIQFIEWFKDLEGTEFEINKISTIDIRDYCSFLQNAKNEKVGTINLKIASLKSYFACLLRSTLINNNPTLAIKKLKTTIPTEVKSFDDKTYRAIRKEVYRSQNNLHISLWEVLVGTPCHVSELCNLKLNSVTITERTARIIFTGRGNKIGELKLHIEARNAILQYLKTREKIKSDSTYLFLSERKDKFTRSGIWKLINKYSTKAKCHISVHQIQKYVLKTLLKNGADVTAISGHNSTLVNAKIYTLASKEDQYATTYSLN